MGPRVLAASGGGLWAVCHPGVLGSVSPKGPGQYVTHGVSGQCVTQPLWSVGVSGLTGDEWVIPAGVFVAATSHLAGRQSFTGVPFLLDFPYHQHMGIVLLS